MHPFRKFISNYCDLPSKDWETISIYIEKRLYRQGEFLLEEGKICRHLYFLESGLLRYFIWKDGQDNTKFFTEPPYAFTSQRSFSMRLPAQENIEALSDSLVWQMRQSDAYTLLELKSWNTFVRNLIQEVQFFTEQILEEIQNETAEERYRKMLLNADPLLQQVPLKHLASYLGIAPQSLSRIRKKLMVEAK